MIIFVSLGAGLNNNDMSIKSTFSSWQISYKNNENRHRKSHQNFHHSRAECFLISLHFHIPRGDQLVFAYPLKSAGCIVLVVDPARCVQFDIDPF
jgi:hypothetical protein